MGSLRGRRRIRRVRIGTPDPTLTPVSGLLAVTELVDRLDVIDRLDAAIGPIKQRRRGHTGGQLLVGIAAAQLAGEDFLVGLDRHRADEAGQQLTPVPGLCATTAAGLSRRFTTTQWAAIETGLGDVHPAALAALAAVTFRRAAALTESVTIDLDTTDVEVYGRHKRGVAYNHQGQRVGRPHVATWADTATVLAADLLAGNEDPRRDAPELLHRALAALPAAARAGRIRCAPTPATSPDSWPAPPCSPTSSSPSAPAGSRRCGGCWTGSPRPIGPTRSTWRARRSPWPTTAVSRR